MWAPASQRWRKHCFCVCVSCAAFMRPGDPFFRNLQAFPQFSSAILMIVTNRIKMKPYTVSQSESVDIKSCVYEDCFSLDCCVVAVCACSRGSCCVCSSADCLFFLSVGFPDGSPSGERLCADRPPSPAGQPQQRLHRADQALRM